jgi:ribonucleoside-triphosphate reductase (thioredoxin)
MRYSSFELDPTFMARFRGLQPNWGPIGYFTFKRTYARPDAINGTEEFWQTCKRVVEGVYQVQKSHCLHHKLPWSDSKAQRSAQEMYERMWGFKWLPPGRGLWVMGTDVIESKGGAALNNCAFVSTENIDRDFTGPFEFLMDMSMLGVGVGADTLGAGLVNVVKPETNLEVYAVADSREGWVALVRRILLAYIGKERLPREIDYSLLRPKGAPLKGFGGKSSGSEPLIDLVANIHSVLQLPEGLETRPITTTQIVDLFNYIGKCVVSGGIRRTAEIMFGEPGDQEFIDLKQDKEALYDRRWASNNSIKATVGQSYRNIAPLIASNGEPGVIWLENMQAYSRMKDVPDYKDYRVMGSNPCSEQSLESYELCCLVETFPANHNNLDDWQRTLKYAYLYAKTVTLVPTHNSRTNAVTLRNRRIGCSQSGIVQAMEKFGRHKYLQGCDLGYEYVQRLDVQYSDWLCIPKSIKTTSVKPSGTVSLLCGATPGIHYPHSEYYIRNVRVDESSPLLEAAKNTGHYVEPCQYAPNTWVVSFPIKEENFRLSKDDISIWQQFANAADLQAYWADNQVSITVTFNSDEAKDIEACLDHFQTRLKSISLLPISDHKYEQAPYIKISEKKYHELKNKITGDISIEVNAHDTDDQFCDGAKCEL